MKRFLYLIIIVLLIGTGCGKKNESNILKDYKKTLNNIKSYSILGTMDINNNEDTFSYDIEVLHLKDDFYKVNLKNKANNHEQVILKNKDSVYVVTPSLNKSFKFQSEWPENSSQTYILESILYDMENSKELKIEKQNNQIVVKSEIDYPNNSELTYQKVYFNNKNLPEKVEVYNNDNILKIKTIFTKIDTKANLNENDFVLEDLIKENECTEPDGKCEDTKTSSSLDDIIYPLFIPSDTYLTNSETLETENGERVILTFKGEKNFVIIEEIATRANDFEIIPVYGEPLMLSDSVAALSSNSLYWTSNNIDYYLASTDLSSAEMLQVAISLNNSALVAGNK